VSCIRDDSCIDIVACNGVEECVPTTGCAAGENLPAGDSGSLCTMGVGECRREGPIVCDGAGGDTCAAVPASPQPDTDCDAADDDCDGAVDEDYGNPPVLTSCGVGACTRLDPTWCAGGMVMDACMPGAPGIEVCNAIDDDCDGAVDEGGLADDDGDTICDAADPCPFHPDPLATAPADAVIVRGTMAVESTHQDGVGGVLPSDFNALPSITVRTVAFGGVRETITDCEGNFAYVLPAGTSLPSGQQDVAFRMQGDVTGPGGITSEIVVVDDNFDE